MKIINILNQEIKKRQEKNSRYSLRAFSRDLGISPGHLSQLLQGKKNFSLSTMNKIINSLNIPNEEKEIMLSNIEIDETSKHDIINLLSSSFNPSDKKVKFFGIEEYKKITHWKYELIFELLEKEYSIEEHITYISKALKISESEVEEKIDQLIQVDLVSIKDDKYHKEYDLYHMEACALETRDMEFVELCVKSQSELFEMFSKKFLADEPIFLGSSAHFLTQKEYFMMKNLIKNFYRKSDETLSTSKTAQSVEDKEPKERRFCFFNTQVMVI